MVKGKGLGETSDLIDLEIGQPELKAFEKLPERPLVPLPS
jgi:hypothetical protein